MQSYFQKRKIFKFRINIKFVFLVFFLSISSLFLSFKNVENSFNLPIKTPALLQRTTKIIELPNGLQVYIVSDPSITSSAAAMAINVGSWDDPKQYPGMAHFTEHMLFQGTGKYPSREEFTRFMADHSGQTNAYTSMDRTLYMFTINNSSFLQGLDRFAQFFIDPIFDPNAIESELFAVDQEHEKNIGNDLWREFSIWKNISNQNHPNHNFSTGNAETLSKIPRDELIRWHNQFYFAQNMKLVIYTNIDAEQIALKINNIFALVPSKNKKRKEIENTYQRITDKSREGTILYIKPIKDMHNLSISWELSPNFANDTTFSGKVLAYAFNIAQKKSLYGILKKEGYINDLTASYVVMSKTNPFFEINMDLTEEGLQNKDLILEKCFEAIDFFKKNDIPSYIFTENKNITKINYQYQEKQNAFAFVSKIASDLLEEDITSYPQNTLFATHYSPETIHKILNELTPSSSQITLIVNPEKVNVELSQIDPYSGAEFEIKKIPSSVLQIFGKAKYLNNFAMPKKNPFIPSNLEIISSLDIQQPIEVFNNPIGKGYFFPSDYKTPKTIQIFDIKTPNFFENSKFFVLVDLFLKHFNEELSLTYIQAKSAGLSFTTNVDHDKIRFFLKGYMEKAPILLQKVLTKLKKIRPNKTVFENHLQSLRMSYNNKKHNLPLSQAMDKANTIFFPNEPAYDKKLKILNSITYEEFEKFASTLFQKAYFECSFSGNMSIKDCESIWVDIGKYLTPTPYDISQNVYTPPNFSNGPYKIFKNTTAPGSGIILLINNSPFTFKRNAAHEILSCSIKEPFYTEMRSKQKTAYIVQSWDQNIENNIYQFFALQSSNIVSEELLFRFEFFIENYLSNILENVNNERFEKIKNSLILKLSTPHENLYEQTYINHMLAYKYKNFNWIKEKIENLNNISYSEFITYCNSFLSKQNKKRMAILMQGELDKNKTLDYKKTSLKNFSQNISSQ